jgi:hypothetical protein
MAYAPSVASSLHEPKNATGGFVYLAPTSSPPWRIEYSQPSTRIVPFGMASMPSAALSFHSVKAEVFVVV